MSKEFFSKTIDMSFLKKKMQIILLRNMDEKFRDIKEVEVQISSLQLNYQNFVSRT